VVEGVPAGALVSGGAVEVVEDCDGAGWLEAVTADSTVVLVAAASSPQAAAMRARPRRSVLSRCMAAP
jgi:hypothetical protein